MLLSKLSRYTGSLVARVKKINFDSNSAHSKTLNSAFCKTHLLDFSKMQRLQQGSGFRHKSGARTQRAHLLDLLSSLKSQDFDPNFDLKRNLYEFLLTKQHLIRWQIRCNARYSLISANFEILLNNKFPLSRSWLFWDLEYVMIASKQLTSTQFKLTRALFSIPPQWMNLTLIFLTLFPTFSEIF